MSQSNTRYFWLSAEQMRRMQPFFPKVRGRARSNDCKVLSGIIYVKRNGLRWQDAPAVYGPYKTLYNRFARWSRMGIFARIFQDLARPGAQGEPMLVDAHAHLDKGHIIDRAPDSGCTHPGARCHHTGPRRDWRRDDLIRRMTFGLSCAEAHGVAAIRTHLDSHAGQALETWGAFAEIRDTWKGRVALQGVALVPLDAYRGEGGRDLADLVARHGGLMGRVARALGGAHGEG